MLKTEFNALRHLFELHPSFAPKPYHYFEFQGAPCLIMEYIASHAERMQNDHQTDLAEVLGMLHSHKADNFGWEEDNFIGALPQYNTTGKEELSWPDFYWKYRISPQLEMAIEKGYFEEGIRDNDIKFIDQISSLYSEVSTPTLTHGDLWSGNYLIEMNGKARLIDPAICYSHPDMDIAMSKLFGGFSNVFYERYRSVNTEELPSLNGNEDIFQLYYLLVHLNLFGTGYLTQCKNILHKYGIV